MSIHYVGASKLGEFDRMEQQQGVLSYNLMFSEGCVRDYCYKRTTQIATVLLVSFLSYLRYYRSDLGIIQKLPQFSTFNMKKRLNKPNRVWKL